MFFFNKKITPFQCRTLLAQKMQVSCKTRIIYAHFDIWFPWAKLLSVAPKKFIMLVSGVGGLAALALKDWMNTRWCLTLTSHWNPCFCQKSPTMQVSGEGDWLSGTMQIIVLLPKKPQKGVASCNTEFYLWPSGTKNWNKSSSFWVAWLVLLELQDYTSYV